MFKQVYTINIGQRASPYYTLTHRSIKTSYFPADGQIIRTHCLRERIFLIFPLLAMPPQRIEHFIMISNSSRADPFSMPLGGGRGSFGTRPCALSWIIISQHTHARTRVCVPVAARPLASERQRRTVGLHLDRIAITACLRPVHPSSRRRRRVAELQTDSGPRSRM